MTLASSLVDDGTRVLVVDDEHSVRDVLSRFLVERGYVVDAAEDGEQALEMILSEVPDIVLLDLKMPRLDGIELLKRLRLEGVDVAVITISGHADEETARESLRLGAADFINKPFDLEYLETSLLAKLLSLGR
jgi:DNA-binding response OmpR family regulator